jgi:hypothetical protein
MRREGRALHRKLVEPVIHDQVRQAIDALGGHFFEKALERLHKVHERHAPQAAQVPIHHGLVAVSLGDEPIDVAERSPDVCHRPLIVEDWGLRLVGQELDTLQDGLDPGGVVGR